MLKTSNGNGWARFAARSIDDGPVRTLVVEGELDVAVQERLDEAVRAALDDRPELLVIDLSAVEFIGVPGIHCLRHARQATEARQVRLEVRPADPLVHRLFTMTGTDAAFPFV